MLKPLQELAFDIEYLKNHTLQPSWFKVLKIFILIAVFIVYTLFFGLSKTLLFIAIFFLFGLLIHYTYRIKTKRYTLSWADFRVKEENGKLITERIGIIYYSAVILSA